MEVAAIKRTRARKRKRRLRKRRRERLKFEVMSTKRRKVVEESSNVYIVKDKLTTGTMQADAFWKNYTAAHEWQKRHNVSWWKSRCFALEYENKILRDKLRCLSQHGHHQSNSNLSVGYVPMPDQHSKEENEVGSEEEELEFQVNEDMLAFLEQSLRHKMELKQKRESELATAELEREEQCSIEGGAAWVRARNEEAKLLYGESSPRILAMEAALNATVDRHKDKAKPQYWPNIALRP